MLSEYSFLEGVNESMLSGFYIIIIFVQEIKLTTLQLLTLPLPTIQSCIAMVMYKEKEANLHKL